LFQLPLAYYERHLQEICATNKDNRDLNKHAIWFTAVLIFSICPRVTAEETLEGSASVTDNSTDSGASIPAPAPERDRRFPMQAADYGQSSPQAIEQTRPVFQMQAQQFQQQAYQQQAYQHPPQNAFPVQTAYANQQHGQFEMGTVGFHISDTGVVQKIYPGSDVLRFGIHKGDRVLGYNGHPFVSVQNIVNEAVGIPGSIMELTFLHDGHVITIPAKRVDARMFQKYSGWGYNRINQAINMDRSW
jgi:hypothetical protein